MRRSRGYSFSAMFSIPLRRFHRRRIANKKTEEEEEEEDREWEEGEGEGENSHR